MSGYSDTPLDERARASTWLPRRPVASRATLPTGISEVTPATQIETRRTSGRAILTASGRVTDIPQKLADWIAVNGWLNHTVWPCAGIRERAHAADGPADPRASDAHRGWRVSSGRKNFRIGAICGCVHRLCHQRRNLVLSGPAIRPSRNEAPVSHIVITRVLRAPIRISIPPLGQSHFCTGEICSGSIDDLTGDGGHDAAQWVVRRAFGWPGSSDLGRRRDRYGHAVPSRNLSAHRTPGRARRHCHRGDRCPAWRIHCKQVAATTSLLQQAAHRAPYRR